MSQTLFIALLVLVVAIFVFLYRRKKKVEKLLENLEKEKENKIVNVFKNNGENAENFEFRTFL